MRCNDMKITSLYLKNSKLESLVGENRILSEKVLVLIHWLEYIAILRNFRKYLSSPHLNGTIYFGTNILYTLISQKQIIYT